MAFFSKTLDKLKGALRKTAEVLNTDVRTLFIPGRQIDDAFLDRDGGAAAPVATWACGTSTGSSARSATAGGSGKIRNADEAGRRHAREMLGILT